jgi:hypothetical protein
MRVIAMDKKGQIGGARKAMSIILGLIFFVLGGLPLLNKFNILSFSLPRLPMMVLWILALVGAIVLIIDGFHEARNIGPAKAIGIASIVMALILIVWGVGSFGILPFTIPAVGILIIDIIFVIAGILLILGTFMAGY